MGKLSEIYLKRENSRYSKDAKEMFRLQNIRERERGVFRKSS